MSSNQPALILFDIDGTLLEPGDREHAQALLDAFREVFDREPELDGTPLAGMLDAEITRIMARRHGLAPARIEDGVERVMQRMGELYEQRTAGTSNQHRLLPGVHEAIRATHGQGWQAGVLTGNARSVAEIKLARAGLDTLEVIGGFGDSATDRGHLVEAAWVEIAQRRGRRYLAHETILVGDPPRDLAAARHAGAKVVTVSTGRYDTQSLRSHEPDAALENLADTGAFLNEVWRILNAG